MEKGLKGQTCTHAPTRVSSFFPLFFQVNNVSDPRTYITEHRSVSGVIRTSSGHKVKNKIMSFDTWFPKVYCLLSR